MEFSPEQLQQLTQALTPVLSQVVDAKLGAWGSQPQPEEDMPAVGNAPPEWADVLSPSGRDSSNLKCQQLMALWSTPPLLIAIKHIVQKYERFNNVPATPAAREHRLDRQLFFVQHRLEMAMHILLHQLENPADETLLDLAAILRSVFEEVFQQRRVLAAKGRTSLLNPRPDKGTNSLLSDEEERRLHRAKGGWQRKPVNTADEASSKQSNNKGWHTRKGKGERPSSTGRGRSGRGRGQSS